MIHHIHIPIYIHDKRIENQNRKTIKIEKLLVAPKEVKIYKIVDNIVIYMEVINIRVKMIQQNITINHNIDSQNQT